MVALLARFDFRLRCELEPKMLASLPIRPALTKRIGESQKQDAKLVEFIQKLEPENIEFDVNQKVDFENKDD